MYIRQRKLRKDVREYLLKLYAGKRIQMYIPKVNGNERRTRAKTIKLLRKHGYTDKEICKNMGIFPSILRRIEKQEAK